MSKIILGEEQQQALNKVIDFIRSKETAFTIIGYAGTGKSLLAKHIIEYLEDSRVSYTLCAPTHKAKVVLERFTNRSAITLHKLLSLAPDIEIVNLDFNFLKFSVGYSKEHFPFNGVIFCDESSMINDDLFDLLIDRCKSYGCKVIFSGDKAQLRPVNGVTHSKVFDLENNCAVLNKIYRQSTESGLVTVLPRLREEVIDRFEEATGSEGSLYCTDDVRELFKYALPSFRKSIKNSDILESKLLAYTNNRVSALNLKMKEILFGDKEEYSKLEFLTGYENLEYNNTKFWNSMDYVVTNDPIKKDVKIPNFLKLPGYYLNLYNESSDVIEDVFILSKEITTDYFDSLAYHIESTRMKAIDAKKSNDRYAKYKWIEYYKLIKSFTSPIDLYYENRLIRKKSFDYGYAISVHKS